jgi:hypothetical protein
LKPYKYPLKNQRKKRKKGEGNLDKNAKCEGLRA